MRKRSVAGAVALAMALAGCQQEAPSQSADEAAEAPETKPGLSLIDGTLMLPVVDGRPGAAYFTVRNGSDRAVTLAGVSVEGAQSAEIHETVGGSMSRADDVTIEPGQDVNFERGGLHVMVFGLPPEMTGPNSPASTTEVTLTFADGDKLSAPFSIQSMGSDGGMAGMAGEAN